MPMARVATLERRANKSIMLLLCGAAVTRPVMDRYPEPHRPFMSLDSSQQVIGENEKTQHRRQLVTVRAIVLADRQTNPRRVQTTRGPVAVTRYPGTGSPVRSEAPTRVRAATALFATIPTT